MNCTVRLITLAESGASRTSTEEQKILKLSVRASTRTTLSVLRMEQMNLATLLSPDDRWPSSLLNSIRKHTLDSRLHCCR